VTAPLLKRRLASMIYEGMLLFGVLFISGWIFSTLLQQRHALYLRNALQIWLFFVVGVYFIWCWTHGGQTLPMKTWRMRVVDAQGAQLKPLRALVRYLLCWLWFLPGLACASMLEAKGWMLMLLPTVNFLIWASTALLDKDGQFLHDRLAGTRLIQTN
jgi:uncharacterized RDD family membrane protein YckC